MDSSKGPCTRDRPVYRAGRKRPALWRPGVGKTHLAIALGRAIVEAGHSVLFTSATALLAALAKADTDGPLADRLLFYSKPKLLIIDELGFCRSSGAAPTSFFSSWRAATSAAAC